MMYRAGDRSAGRLDCVAEVVSPRLLSSVSLLGASLGLAVATALLAQGAAGAASPTQAIQYAATTSASVTAQLNVNQSVAALSKQTVLRFGGDAVTLLRVGGPPAGWESTDEDGNLIVAPSGRWIHATVAIPAVGVRAMRAMWEADIVIAALREQLEARSRRIPVLGAQITGRLPDGTETPIGGGIGVVRLAQDFGESSVAEVESALRRRADAAALQITSIETLRPLQLAPAVVAVTHDPAGFVSEADARMNELFGGVAAYEAEYVEVRDRAGSLVFVQASAFRTGVGRRWIRPDLDTGRRD